MIYPQAMSEVELIVPSRDLVEVTRVITGQGIFHQADSSYMSPDIDQHSPNPWPERSASYTSLERRLQTLMQTLTVYEGHMPSKDVKNLADLAVLEPAVDAIEKEVRRVTDQLSVENKKVEQYHSVINQLEPVADIDLDISSLRSSRYMYGMLGVMPTANIERMETSLARIPFIFVPLRQDPQNSVVWLAGAQNNADVLDRAARSAYLNRLALPEDYLGTPKAIIAELQEQVRQAEAEIVRLNAELDQLSQKYKTQIQAFFWDAHAGRMMTSAIVHYGRLRYTYLIVGWVPTANIASFNERLKKVSRETIIEVYDVERGGHKQNVPVSLKNGRLLQPFQMLVTTYANPRYNEIDPTILIAITFPLLFGAMFGDVGHGLILALVGFLGISGRVKMLRGLGSLNGVILACGLSATIFGFLYGSVLGFEDVLHPLWMHPIENILQILIVAIGAGLVLMSISFLLSIYNAFLARDWAYFFFSKNAVAGLVFYWSMLGLAASIALPAFPVPTIVFIILAAIGAIAIAGTEVFERLMHGHRPLIEGGIGGFLFQAFFELFETVLSLFSNSLSYVRVGAFAVAHGGLSQVFFILAGMAGGPHSVGYYIVLLIGNIFIIGFEGLIVGIQTMRLEYYEFFSKFFTGGGLRYEPLTLGQSAED